MPHIRKYGQPPFQVAVIHGGPGAAGEMAPVARALAKRVGVLEPLQTATSIQEQLSELRAALIDSGIAPFTLIGFSWGAWLALLLASRHIELTRKVVIVGSGPMEEKWTRGILQTRLSRLGESERKEAESLLEGLNQGKLAKPDRALERFGALCSKADSYDPEPESEPVECQAEVFRKVWAEASALRKSGGLLESMRHIRCPVVAIHGACDPHPAEGVLEPLSTVLHDFRFHLLDRCGHTPWIERQARDRFFELLESEL